MKLTTIDEKRPIYLEEHLAVVEFDIGRKKVGVRQYTIHQSLEFLLWIMVLKSIVWMREGFSVIYHYSLLTGTSTAG